MRFLKTGVYYVDVFNEKLLYSGIYNGCINDDDCSDLVKDFQKFSQICIDIDGDTISLVADDRFGAYFVRWPNHLEIPVDEIIDFTNNKICVISKKEEKKMDDQKVLTPEERIEQLEKEKAELELQIKNQAKYDELKKNSDEISLVVKAMQDSGFSREEAMSLILAIAPAAALPNPFRRR